MFAAPERIPVKVFARIPENLGDAQALLRNLVGDAFKHA